MHNLLLLTVLYIIYTIQNYIHRTVCFRFLGVIFGNFTETDVTSLMHVPETEVTNSPKSLYLACFVIVIVVFWGGNSVNVISRIFFS